VEHDDGQHRHCRQSREGATSRLSETHDASGAEYARDYGTSQSSRTILKKILKKNKSFYLDVQREIIDEGKRLSQVEAGKVFKEQLLEAREEYEERLRSLSEELKHTHSKEMREALEEQQVKATEVVRRAEAAQQQLNEQYGKKFDDQEKLFKDMMEKLRQDYDEKLERASGEEREKLLKQQQELNKALRAADKGDSSVMWTVVSQLSSPCSLFIPVRTNF
jgi:Asp-tRNA(Asn)/Glu-tRNA(Gln) amidotransferase A subunit family amidase